MSKNVIENKLTEFLTSDTAQIIAISGAWGSGKTYLAKKALLVTSADSGILVMNTIMSGGEQKTGIKHRIVWGVILTLVIGTLLIAGKTNGGSNPMEALRSAMIIGALPFTLLMGLMCVSLGKAMWRDHLRETKSLG